MPNVNQKIKMEAIRAEIIRRNKAGESFAAISLAMGAKKGGTLAYKIFNGETKGERLSADKVQRYMAGLGLKDEEQKHKEPDVDDFVLVRKVSARLGAGSSLLTDDSPDGYYSFRKSWLESLGMLAKPVLMQVMGESMIPTLLDSDMVLIDEADKDIRSGKLYAVGIGEELLIKRVFMKPDGAIVLKSDNPEYPTWEVQPDEQPRIIGRARWVGRML